MKPKFTHTGTIVPISAAALGKAYSTQLRETKRWYVTEHGLKYSKNGGWRLGEKYPHWMLDINTLKPLA